MQHTAKRIRLDQCSRTPWISRKKVIGINSIGENILEMIFRYLVETGCKRTILKSVCTHWYGISRNFLRAPPANLVISHNTVDIYSYEKENDLKICFKIQAILDASNMDDETVFLRRFKALTGYLNHFDHLLLNIDGHGSTVYRMYKILQSVMGQKKNEIFTHFSALLSSLTEYNTYRQLEHGEGIELRTMMRLNVDLMFYAIQEHFNFAFKNLHRIHPVTFTTLDTLSFMRKCCLEENEELLIYLVQELQYSTWEYEPSSWLSRVKNMETKSTIKALEDISSICKSDSCRLQLENLLNMMH